VTVDEVMARLDEARDRRAVEQPGITTGPPNTDPFVSSWEAVDLGPVLRGERTSEPPAVLERVDGVRLLYRGKLNLLHGETESMKTWVADVAAAEAITDGLHVVFMDYEDDAETTVERLVALGMTTEAIAAHLTYIQPLGPFDDLARALVEERIDALGEPAVVVVDSVVEAMSALGLDPNSGPDVVAFFGSFPRWFARLGACVILLDHVVKDRESRGRWAIGSERKLSGLDGAAYGFEVVQPLGRGSTGRVKLVVSKDRPGHVRRYLGRGSNVVAILRLESSEEGAVVSHLDAPEVRDPSAPFRPTTIMERISRALEAAPMPLTQRTVIAQTTGKKDTVTAALELLVAEGHVRRQSGTNRSILYRSERPFRATETPEHGGGHS